MIDSTRRGLVATGLAAAAGAGLAVQSAQAAPSLDLSDGKKRLRAFMRLRGSLDQSLVAGCISGRYYGVVGAEVRPLYGVTASTFVRYRELPDGRFEGFTYEVAYFTDLETGKVMDRWANPYTGETVDVAHTFTKPARVVIGEDLVIRPEPAIPGLQIRHATLSPLIIGPDLWWTEEVLTEAQIPGMAKPLHYSELVTLQTSVAELASNKTSRVTCRNAYSSVVNWRPWLKMGDAPGHLMGNGAGAWGVATKDLPAAWIEATKERHPDVLADPGARLEPLWLKA
jgi:hypothetical protein